MSRWFETHRRCKDERYLQDPDPAHSTAQFVVRHMMITNVRGAFSNIQGAVTWDAANPSATAIHDVTIDASTINTNEPQRDAHLKSADFLDVEKFPSITFRGTGAEAAGDDEVSVKGELTIHGVKRSPSR